MKVALIQFIPWDKIYYLPLNSEEGFRVGEYLIISIDNGLDAGKIIEVREKKDEEPINFEKIDTYERVATNEDRQTIKANEEENDEHINYCRKLSRRHDLEMKIVDCYTSFDGQKVTFAFIADGRVDFRALVKDLTRHFQKSVRLHQLGVRDEAKFFGNIGCCGESQCCRTHLNKLGNVSSEMAEVQQIAHRGSERLSGICGRLKCCLAYEKDLYEELSSKLPAVGTKVRTKHGRGVVIGWHTLKSSVNVKLDPEKEGDKEVIVEIPIE